MLTKKAKIEYEATLQEVVRRVTAREFGNNYELSAAFDRTLGWASHMRQTIVKRGLMTAQEWEQAFSRRGEHVAKWKCRACGATAGRVPFLEQEGIHERELQHEPSKQ